MEDWLIGRVAVWVLMPLFCQSMTKGIYSSSASGTGLKVTCLPNGKTVEIKPSIIATSTNIHHVTVGNGSSLSCMCSVLNNSLSLDKIRWIQKGKGSSLNQTLKNGNGIQLTVSPAGWTLNESIFECGLDDGTLGVAFMLIVGDRPGPPLNAVAGPYYQGLRVNWTAAHFTGGLPVNYSVKFSTRSNTFPDCFNFIAPCLELPDETVLRKGFVHVPGKVYSCVVIMNIQLEPKYNKCIYSPKKYRVWITAENAVGSANSSNTWMVIPEDYKYSNTMIHAPGNVRATDIGAHGFTVSFRKGKFWIVDVGGVNYGTKLTLLDDEGNVVHQQKGNVPLTRDLKLPAVNGLKPYMLYKVYLQVRIEKHYEDENQHFYTSYSRPAHITVRTKQAAPSLAAPITSCNGSVVLVNNTELRNVNISWQEPPNVTWNSPWLEGFELIYVRRDEVARGEKEHAKAIDNITRHLTLKLKSFATYDVWLKTCNAEGQCSSRGMRCRIPPLAFPPLFVQGSTDNQLLNISVGLIVPVFVILIVGLVYLRCRKKCHPPQTGRLEQLEITVDGYTEIYNSPQAEAQYNDGEVTK